MRRRGVPLWFTWRTVLPETGVLCSLSDRFVALASKTWRCIDGKVNNGSNGGDANIIKRCHVGDSSAVFDVERIRPSWLQQPSLCSKEALLIKQSTDQFSSMQKRVSFISRGSLRPSATYVKRATLVCWFRGSFRAVLFYQAEPVFPDWRMMMFVVACVSVLL